MPAATEREEALNQNIEKSGAALADAIRRKKTIQRINIGQVAYLPNLFNVFWFLLISLAPRRVK
jgi:hypothetical protein